MEITEFTVRAFKKDGSIVGHAVAVGTELPKDINDAAEAAKGPIEKFNADFEKRSKEFISAMLGYVDYVPLIVSVSLRLSREIAKDAVSNFLETNRKQKQDTDEQTTYVLGIEHLPQFERIQETRSAAFAMGREVPRALTISLVASFEHHLSLLVRDILYSNKNFRGLNTRKCRSVWS